MLVAPRPEHAVPQQRSSQDGRSNGPALVSLTGELDVAELARTELRLEEVMLTGVREVVVDVSEVASMDLRTLRLLLGADARLRARGGRLRLREPSRPVRRLLAVAACRHLADDADVGRVDVGQVDVGRTARPEGGATGSSRRPPSSGR